MAVLFGGGVPGVGVEGLGVVVVMGATPCLASLEGVVTPVVLVGVATLAGLDVVGEVFAVGEGTALVVLGKTG